MPGLTLAPMGAADVPAVGEGVCTRQRAKKESEERRRSSTSSIVEREEEMIIIIIRGE